MSQRNISSLVERWLTIILVLAVVISYVAFGFWIGTFSSRRAEKIHFDSCQWLEDPFSDSFTQCDLFIANTGTNELTVNKVWINGTLLGSAEWESLPSMKFQPGDQGVLQITPSLIVFQKGITYRFTIETTAGNSFSYPTRAESTSHSQTD